MEVAHWGYLEDLIDLSRQHIIGYGSIIYMVNDHKES